MLNSHKIVCIIPARLNSVRFPQKILFPLLQKPLLKWVWEAANKVSFFDDVIFAIDSDITASLTRSFSARYIMTSKDCLSGTDRIIEILKIGKIQSDIWVNWQGDEPFITEGMIKTLLQNIDDEHVDVWTLKKKVDDKKDITSPNVVKVVSGQQNQAIYFSRQPIPFHCNNVDIKKRLYYKHIGLYAYTTKALNKISTFSHTPLELTEKLEQLRWLEYGLSIKVYETNQNTIGIDVPENIQHAEKFLKAKNSTMVTPIVKTKR